MVMMQRIVERHGSTPVPKKTSTEMVLPLGKIVMIVMPAFIHLLVIPMVMVSTRIAMGWIVKRRVMV